MSVRRACSILNLPRSSFYAKRKPAAPRVIEKSLESNWRWRYRSHRSSGTSAMRFHSRHSA
ncbi:hypothetical protein GHO40_18355 [Pseudomonas helleri]|uniref:IS3 family transposase n=1 Tax=Pseudomonas helleri TaxID=1608996 RepID=A0A7X1WB86_9PSED|nr:hypothetical protein [Pseudomonas helleri]MQT89993.1 hypothetical protein [Pseudomonas helleri]